MLLENIESYCRELQNQVSKSLEQVGIMHRIFSRVKDCRSLELKIRNKEGYLTGDKKIQDIIGVRVVLYFPDDIEITRKIVSQLFEACKKDNSISELNTEIFRPVRYNLIYKIKQRINTSHIIKQLKLTFEGCNLDNVIDDTFELQIRTVLSEGWHEVEHDLRYKHQDDWANNHNESRRLNGIYASLETNEWSMIQIFHSLAYHHYKNRNWESMFRQVLRLRLINAPLFPEVKEIFDNDVELAKKFFKLDREFLISTMHSDEFNYPLNINNIIYFYNFKVVKNEKINRVTPETFIMDCSRGNN